MNHLIFPQVKTGSAAWGLLALRMVLGCAMVLHGWGKIQTPFSWMGEGAPVPAILQALAALSEFGGGLAMLIGLLTPLAALGIISTMTVAVLMVHVPAGHPFVSVNDPGQPAYELALTYLVIALNILLMGPGAYSLDALLFRPAPRPHTNLEIPPASNMVF